MEEVGRYHMLHCFNPFKKVNHVYNKKRLRTVSEWMCKLFSEMPNIAKVCDSCRKQLGVLKKEQEGQCSSSQDVTNDTELKCEIDPPFVSESEVVQSLNISLQELGQSPVDITKVKGKKYSKQKIQKINSAIKRTIFAETESSESDSEGPSETVLSNLKAKFRSSNNRKTKLMILTCLPESWSIKKIMYEFNAPNYMVRHAKKLLKVRGILSTPDQKPGKSLSAETAETIKQFYESDDISRVMPGKKDCLSVRDDTGAKIQVSKRLILCNLKEVYKIFKEKFPNMQVSFSKFAELRPKNCVLAGHNGTHTVCVCTIHQNMKLMIENARLASLTNGTIKTYQDCLEMVICNPPSLNCHLRDCTSCHETAHLKNLLEEAFEENMVEELTFHQWISVDRCTLEIMQKSATDFIDLFCEKLSALVRHDFIAKQQRIFANHTKENLKDSEFVVLLDFAENYSFIIQDEAQGYHWTSTQATIHPFVVYYKLEGKIEHLTYVVISDCLEHNTVAVYCFQKKLINFLQTTFAEKIKKIIYFSDGSAAQYKNKKNFANLCFHKDDFNIEAEWHFWATAHGKGPCDGVSGTVKRLAARASLQRPYDKQILTPEDLYVWAKENITAVNFTFSTQEEHIETAIFLHERFKNTVTIPGTQKFHAFIPAVSSTKMVVKTFSLSQSSLQQTVISSQEKLSFPDINGYITAAYSNNWWLAYVLEKNESTDEIKVTFLKPAGPSPSFSYPRNPDVLWIPSVDILYKVNPTTPTGRMYTLPEVETVKTNEIFSQFHQKQQH